MLKMIRLLLDEKINFFYKPVLLSVCIISLQVASYFVVYFLLTALKQDSEHIFTVKIILLMLSLLLLFYGYYAFTLLFIRSSISKASFIITTLRTRICEHLRQLPLAFFRKNDPSVLSGVLLRNMAEVERFFGLYIYEILSCILVPLFLGVTMLFMDWRISLSMFASTFMAIPFAAMASRLSMKQRIPYVSALAKLDASLLEYFNGLGELKGACRTGAAFTPYTKNSEYFLRLSLDIEAKNGILIQLFIAAMDMVFVAAMVFGSILLINGNLQWGVFLFFLIMAYRFVDPLQNLGVFWTILKYAFASMHRIAVILREKTLPFQNNTSTPAHSGIEFSNVSFAYKQEQLFSDISFTTPPESITALVGESGGGKTTICNLLLRFWDVHSGSISIGNKNIKSFSSEELYSQFSAVFQEVYLFNDSVMNNIRLARADATDAEVLKAATLACCNDFIEQLEDGYETIVGERGSRLSGGERQRIAIARAILKNAPILILDEATASVDPENELQIQRGLNNLARGKTLLVIAHRLTTIRQADQILVLKDGCIAERGKHDDLLQRKGIYAKLWESQEKLKSWRVC